MDNSAIIKAKELAIAYNEAIQPGAQLSDAFSIDRFGEDVCVFPNDKNTFRAVATVAASNVFYSWVFGFGGKVKISSPEQVKKQYADMLRNAVISLE